jgi:predicted transport protein/rubrerythrin
MFIAILTLLSALSISGVAIFYSVIGLATIFPGAFWPVVIMGSVLEVGKLVTASWLYRNWKQTRFLLKTYLTIAVVVLSLITSMGIFGFLSKAHLEQNLAENTLTQRIEIINSKIISEETYIKRQLKIIERAENTLNKTSTSNKDAIELEQQSLKDVQDKFKTLLTVETNTVKDLNDRIKTLDANVTAILTQQNKAFFNEEKAAADLKASQKQERIEINVKITEAQNRIKILKDDYAKDTAGIQKRIDSLREGNIDDKSDVNAQIEVAETNILKAQDNIDDLIIDREPLEAKMIKLEAEVGPVKYIASLVVDWGITKEVDTSEAVRWVILIIIFVFDPLAVLLLVAANQSLIRKFPVEPIKPQEIVDLEKPDEEDVTLKWNEMYNKQDAVERMEQATAQLQEWKDKLDAFNAKVPKPSPEAPVQIIQEDRKIPHVDLKGSKNPEDKKIVVDNLKDGFDPAEVEGWEEFNKKYTEPDEDPLEKFKQREKEEQEALEEYSRKAREDSEEQAYEQSISEQIEEAMEPERIKPDFTEVIEPELPIEKPKNVVKNAKPLVMRTIKPKEAGPPKPILSNWQRAELLDNFHKEHGNFQDVQEYVQNEEQSDTTTWKKIKSKTTTEEDYHLRMERRIEDLMAKVDAGEIKLENLTPEDRQVIIEIRNQNKV